MHWGSKLNSTQEQETPKRGGLISIDRLGGLFFVLGGIWLLKWGIPMGVEGEGLDFPSPFFFPQMAAWIFISGGILQIIRAKPGRKLPSFRQARRYVLASALVLAMAWLMDHFGYLVGGMAMLAAMMFLVFEKRWLWIAVAVGAIPIGTWAFFEILLRRPLP